MGKIDEDGMNVASSLEDGLQAIRDGQPKVGFPESVKIGDAGAARVARELAKSTTLELLGLHHNNIGPEGATALSKALEMNQSLQELILMWNSIGPEGATALGEALETHQSLQRLILWNIGIGLKGATALGKALEMNQSLQELILDDNNIGSEGATALGNALETNQSLQTLWLRDNNIGPEGATALGKALETNQSLQTLYLDDNNIGSESATALGKGLATNQSLQTLWLRDNNIGPEGATALGKALETNQSLQTLNLDDNNIGSESATALGKGLATNQSLQTLNLSWNSIGPEGATALGKGLETNRSLQTLTLHKNNIGPEGATALGKALETNWSLQTLNLYENNIGPEGATALGKALETNQSLQTLDLSWNSIGPEGATALGKALETNSSLQTLDLEDNNIGSEGATALGKALERNQSLQTLILGSSRIGSEGATALGKALEMNQSLRELILTWNRIGPEGATALAKALETNQSLQTLNLQGNDIGQTGATALGKALETNRSLQTLDLDYNNIGSWGAPALGKALERNRSLQTLNLHHNNIGLKGVTALGKGLETNQSLQELNLQNNKIGLKGATALGKALEMNQSLQTLILDDNNIGPEGATALCKALETNRSLQKLNLGNNNIDDDELLSKINDKLEANEANKSERTRLEKHFRDAIEAGDEEAWGRAKLMIIGEGAAGKTSTVRSLLGMAPAPTCESTVGVDLKVTRATDWQERPAGESDFDLLACKAAASRAKVTKGTAGTKRASMTAKAVKAVRSSLSRLSLGRSKPSGPAADAEQPPAPPTPTRKLVEEHDVAKRFDFEAVKALTARADDGTADVSFSIWDYGGNEVFCALHHIFLSREGVYLLVFSMRKLLDNATQSSALDFVRFWLNSVKLHAPGAPIVLVGTHLDLVPSREEHEEVDRLLREELSADKKYGVLQNDAQRLRFFPVDNSSTSTSRAAGLRTVVQEAALKLECVRRRVPLAWLKVLDDLLVSKLKYVTFDHVVKMAAEYGMAKRDTEAMLALLHELGVVVHQRATERLHDVVVIEPQWLLDKLSAVINDELHIKDKFFDKDIQRCGLMSDLADFRKTGGASRELLEFLWGDEQVQYLIDFMKDTMLMSDYSEETRGTKYLVTSLMAQERKDKPLDLSDFDSGLTCVLDFSEFFLPKGVFQRLVSTCASFGVEDPELSRSRAVINLEDDAVAFVEEGDAIRIVLIEGAENGPATLKRLVSMFREQRELMFRDLPWRLLLQSPTQAGVMVEYKALVKARESNKNTIKAANSRKRADVAAFASFFEDKAVGALDSDTEGTNVPKHRLKKLPAGLENHVFISHYQKAAADMARVLAAKFEARGVRAWHDMGTSGNLAEPEMRHGIKAAKCYLLLLTKGVFSSPAVCMELETAIKAGKPVLLVHEAQPNLAGFADYGEYIDTCPPFAKHIFDDVESMAFQRRDYLATPFIEELIHRIDGAA